MIKCFDPDIGEKDKKNIIDTLESKILAYGPNVEKFEKEYHKFSNKINNISFNSASSAAFLLYRYLFEKHGPCEVYTTSLGFVSPVTAALSNGHSVTYVDVNDDLLMCVRDLQAKFKNNSEKASIIMPVLYGGVSRVDGYEEFCKQNNALLVLDSAHCITPTIQHDFAFYSFHPVKPICMSNGGLLATDCNDAAEYMFRGRNFGRKLMGDTYDLVQFGFNFYMNNLNAALGLSQLDKCLGNVEKRRKNFNFLKNNLPSEIGYFTKHDKNSSYYLSSLVLSPGLSSAAMRQRLADNEIQTSFHYPFLHTSTHYKVDYGLDKLDSLSDRIINLPIHQNLTEKDLEKIINECICYSRSRR